MNRKVNRLQKITYVRRLLSLLACSLSHSFICSPSPIFLHLEGNVGALGKFLLGLHKVLHCVGIANVIFGLVEVERECACERERMGEREIELVSEWV